MMNGESRKKLTETAVAMNACGLNQGTSGNVSVRCDGGMLITPSGIDYGALSPEDMVWVDYQGNFEGEYKPSSEWRFHADIYRLRTDTHAVLHAHPLNCTALACLGKGIPAFHYMVAVAGGADIRCADYATFGSRELSDNVIAALEDRNACLMAGHGMTCLAENLQRALRLAQEVEHLAAIYTRVLAIGEPDILSESEMALVLEKFNDYGPGRERS